MANNNYVKDNQIPLWRELVRHVAKESMSLHTPGHKGRHVLQDGFGQAFSGILPLDLTELPELDVLGEPKGAIFESQKLIAQTFHALQSFFLVNGSSVGICAMIMTACPPGSKVLIPRNIHRSVLSGIILTGLRPVFIDTHTDTNFGVALPFQIEDVQNKLDSEEGISAVLVVNPTYHGLVGQLADLVKVVRGYRIPLLVDEAHGTHFNFHDKLPATAMDCGVDAAVQSFHKTGVALTQSAVLHCGHGLIKPEELAANLRLLQSTSPSYLLMASLDYARFAMDKLAHIQIEQLIGLVEDFEGKIKEYHGVDSLRDYWLAHSLVAGIDPLKLNLSATALGMDGHKLASLLRSENIEVELTEEEFVLGILSMNSSTEDVEHLLNVLSKISIKTEDFKRLQISAQAAKIHLPQQVISPRDAWFAKKKNVPLTSTLGKISAELVAPCPPGIPIVFPGELVDQFVIDNLQRQGIETLAVVEGGE